MNSSYEEAKLKHESLVKLTVKAERTKLTASCSKSSSLKYGRKWGGAGHRGCWTLGFSF